MTQIINNEPTTITTPPSNLEQTQNIVMDEQIEISNNKLPDGIFDDVPYGWTVLRFDPDHPTRVIMYQNFQQEDVTQVENKSEQIRQGAWFQENVKRLVQYKIEDKLNTYDVVDNNEILHEIGYEPYTSNMTNKFNEDHLDAIMDEEMDSDDYEYSD